MIKSNREVHWYLRDYVRIGITIPEKHANWGQWVLYKYTYKHGNSSVSFEYPFHLWFVDLYVLKLSVRY